MGHLFWKGIAMDGSRRCRHALLAVQREFVSFRLEKQVMIRAYELVVPLLMRESTEFAGNLPQSETSNVGQEQILLSLAKGA